MTLVCSEIPRDADRVALTVRDDVGVVARMNGRVHRPRLFEVAKIVIEREGLGAEACESAARAVARAFPAGDGEILIWERPEAAAWRTAVEATGFAIARRKVFFDRDLREALPPVDRGLELRSLAEVGESALRARLVAVARGDPGQEAAADPDAEWRELVDGGGARFDPRSWFVVDDARGPAGVLLPQPLDETTGTLSYVGVLPERRREGLGLALHATGLRCLADRGSSRYVGSTDVRNEPMQRVFARNGCRRVGVQGFFRARTPRGSDQRE